MWIGAAPAWAARHHVPHPPPAATAPTDLPSFAPTPGAPLGTGRVAALTADGTLRLDDGREVKLAGILIPLPGWPLAARARATLAGLVVGRMVRLTQAGSGTGPGASFSSDRYGRLLAQVVLADGAHPAASTQAGGTGPEWVQGALLRAGLALVEPRADAPGALNALRAAEDSARAASRGLWGDPFYAVRHPDDTDGTIGADAIGRYAVVRGRVRSAATTMERVYLNFGPDWRRDFTVEIDHHDLAAFRRRHIDPTSLKGRLIEVRGWVESLNGPMIRLDDPGPLTILDEPASGP